MISAQQVFSGFSVDDIDRARAFYRDVLGVKVVENPMGFLELELSGGARVLVYDKPNHEPATFTIMNFAVDDVEKAVDDLNAQGVVTKIYDDADFETDEKGISRGGGGPDIAWFRDPAGNVISVMKTS